jgi:LPS export ABC transporter permease LptF
MRPKPSIIFRYLLREVIPFALLTWLILTSLVVAQQLSRQSGLVLIATVPLALTIKFIALLLPSVIIITLPIAILMGTLIACNRLAADSELTALRASGVRTASLAAPFLALALGGTIVTLALTLETIPRALGRIQTLRSSALLQGVATQIASRAFIDRFPNYLLYIHEIDERAGGWEGVFLLNYREGQPTTVLTARRGRLRLAAAGEQLSLEIELEGGTSLTSLSGSNSIATRSVASFEKLYLRLADLQSERAEGAVRIEERSTGALRQLFADRDRQIRRQAQTEYHKRFALPLACLVLATVAFRLGTGSRRSGKALGVTISFLIGLLYYLISVAGQNLVLSGVLLPWAGVWLANAAALATLILWRPLGALRRKARESAPRRSPRRRERRMVERRARQRVAWSPGLYNYLIISELIKYFSLGSLILVATTLLFTLLDIIPSLARQRISAAYAATYLGMLAPQIFYYTAPFALLLAALSAFYILSRTNQVVAVYASGQSPRQLSIPTLLLAAVVAGALLFLSENLLPGTNREQDARYRRIKGKPIDEATLVFGQKWVYGSHSSIYGFQYSAPDNKLLKTYVYRLNPDDHLLREVDYLEEARILPGLRAEVSAGWQYLMPGFRREGRDELRQLDGATLEIPEGATLFRRTVNEASKMNFRELRRYVRHLEEIGVPTHPQRIELYKKIAFPLTCFFLLALAWPFIATRAASSRRSALAGLSLGIVISLSFWLISSGFEMAGRNLLLPVWMAVWSPALLALVFSLYFWARRAS